MNPSLMIDTISIVQNIASYGYGNNSTNDYFTLVHDDYGATVDDWQTTQTVRGRLENLSVLETTVASMTQNEKLNLAMATHIVYLNAPLEVSVNEADRLEISGRSFEVKQVLEARGFSLSHYELRCKEVK